MLLSALYTLGAQMQEKNEPQLQQWTFKHKTHEDDAKQSTSKKAWKVWARQYSLDHTNQFCPAARKETHAEQHQQPLARKAKALIDEMAGAAAARI